MKKSNFPVPLRQRLVAYSTSVLLQHSPGHCASFHPVVYSRVYSESGWGQVVHTSRACPSYRLPPPPRPPSPKRSRCPPLFYISDITNSSSFSGKIFRKKSMLENFRANVLKGKFLFFLGLITYQSISVISIQLTMSSTSSPKISFHISPLSPGGQPYLANCLAAGVLPC